MTEKGKSIPKEAGTYKNNLKKLMLECGYVRADGSPDYARLGKLLEINSRQTMEPVEGMRWASPALMMKLEAVVSWITGEDTCIGDIYDGWKSNVSWYKGRLG